tara:strand:+ start:250 stop:867 length:618 start_codon:yes stop_codon:yes gene_type:complete
MGVISNGTTLLDAGALDSGVATGAMTLIKTLTASSSSTLDFVHGTSSVVLDGTYKEYVFKFINCHPATNNVRFKVNFSTNSGSSYAVTKTTAFFRAYHNEAGNDQGLGVNSSNDLHQQTDNQILQTDIGNGNDESLCGTLTLYDPSSTTFVKHFMTRTNSNNYAAYSPDDFVAGYLNTTSAINGVQFSFDSGSISTGTIKMYGVK